MDGWMNERMKRKRSEEEEVKRKEERRVFSHSLKVKKVKSEK